MIFGHGKTHIGGVATATEDWFRASDVTSKTRGSKCFVLVNWKPAIKDYARSRRRAPSAPAKRQVTRFLTARHVTSRHARVTLATARLGLAHRRAGAHLTLNCSDALHLRRPTVAAVGATYHDLPKYPVFLPEYEWK